MNGISYDPYQTFITMAVLEQANQSSDDKDKSSNAADSKSSTPSPTTKE